MQNIINSLQKIIQMVKTLNRDNLKAKPSWCYRFMKIKGMCMQTGTLLALNSLSRKWIPSFVMDQIKKKQVKHHQAPQPIRKQTSYHSIKLFSKKKKTIKEKLPNSIHVNQNDKGIDQQ